MTTPETINQRKLRQALVDAFNESELQTVCFDLGIDYETLPTGNKLVKARELVALCLRQQRLEELISLCEASRPKVAWREMMAPAVSDKADSANPPFMGLKYFDADQADLFFGRETLTTELVKHLQTNNFLAVVGASGSGKSSLVRAGLVPALQKAETNLKIHIFTPTDYPLEALATTLTRHTDSVGITANFIDELAREPRSLHLAARRLLQENEQLLLVIDQFEELFTLCRSAAERQAFVENLVTAVSNKNGPTRAVIALRADFYHHCAQYDALRTLLEKQQRFIGAMNPAELRRAIELPASQNGLAFEDGLVDLLLRDVGASGNQTPEPGALPLLSHALLETWRRREGNMLTFSSYTDAGGVQGAISKTAESVFSQQLTPEQQSIARSIFLRLTELGEGTQDTRRRALISELLPTSDAAEETQIVLNLLSSARLVTTDEKTAEVAHEALIREWPTLRRWLDDNRDSLRLHRHLTESAQAWQQLKRDPGELYRGARLEQAQEWSVQYDEEFNDLEREFLAASVAAQQKVIEKAQTQQQKELAQAQQLATAQTQATRRARNFNYALIVILFLVIGVAVSLIYLQDLAQEQEEVAQVATRTSIEARETAVAVEATEVMRDIAATTTAEAAQQVDADGDGLTLAQELNYGTDPAQQDSDFDGLSDGDEIMAGTNPLDFDSDFDSLWDGEDNDPIRPFISLIDPLTGEAANTIQLEEILVLNDFFLTESERLPFYGLSISANLHYIAAGSYANNDSNRPTYLNIWLKDGSMITPFDTATEDAVLATGFAPNRLHAVVGSTVYSYDLSGELGWQQSTVTGFGNTLCSAALRPNNSTALVGGRAKWGYLQIIDDGLIEIESDSQNYNTNACYTDAIFSYDGTFFGLVEDEGQDESVFVGQVLNRSFARPFNKSVSGTIDMALSPDNNILALGFENGRVELYDYSERQGDPPIIYGLDAHPSMAHAVFSPDGTILATSSPEDGTVRLWRIGDESEDTMLEIDAEADGVTSLIFSKDGHYLLFGTTAGEVHVYGMPEVKS